MKMKERYENGLLVVEVDFDPHLWEQLDLDEAEMFSITDPHPVLVHLWEKGYSPIDASLEGDIIVIWAVPDSARDP